MELRINRNHVILIGLSLIFLPVLIYSGSTLIIDSMVKDIQVQSSNVDSLEGSGLAQRMKLADIMAKDLRSFTDIFYFENSSVKSPEGFVMDSCHTSGVFRKSSDFTDCESEKDIVGHQVLASNFWLLQRSGNLEKFYSNETLRSDSTDLFQRLQVYESVFGSKEPEWSELEFVMYNEDSGLYLVGKGTNDITIDGENFNSDSDGYWTHVDIDLDSGIHSISSRNSNLNLHVRPPLPREGYDPSEDTVKIESRHIDTEHYFDKAYVNDEENTYTVNISNESREVELSDPSYIETSFEGKSGNFTVVTRSEDRDIFQELSYLSGLNRKQSRILFRLLQIHIISGDILPVVDTKYSEIGTAMNL